MTKWQPRLILCAFGSHRWEYTRGVDANDRSTYGKLVRRECRRCSTVQHSGMYGVPIGRWSGDRPVFGVDDAGTVKDAAILSKDRERGLSSLKSRTDQ